MKKIIFKLFVIFLLPSSFLYANSTFGTIATGSQKGTYIQIGDDISKLFKQYKADLKVLSTKGSIENLEILTGLNPTQKASWAIVQNDALDYFRFLYFKDTREDVKKKIKTLMPLYGEHIHIFKKKGENIEFLRGGFLKVGVSSKKSGAAITANILENNFGTRFKYVYTSFDNAKEYLKEGVIDIYIDVIAMPSKKYTDLQGLDLVELPHNKLLSKTYIPTHFTPDTYKWLDKKIAGYEVPSILVTNLVDPKFDQTVGVFVKIILKNYQNLLQSGHPKWEEAYKNRTFKPENLHPSAQKILPK
jgi:TRAP transporter TAXI family solute receptor